MTEYPTRLYAASSSGSRLTNRFGEVEIERRVIGAAHFPTGQVVACDPLLVYGARAFAQAIAPGNYPVELNIAHMADNGDQRVATALLRVTPAEPARWAMATLPGDNLADLKPGSYFGYGVELGHGLFYGSGRRPAPGTRFPRR